MGWASNKGELVYTDQNFKTKADFRRAVQKYLDAQKNGDPVKPRAVTLFAPGLGSPKANGTEYAEGPWYPQPHSWYAQVEVKDGIVVKVK